MRAFLLRSLFIPCLIAVLAGCDDGGAIEGRVNLWDSATPAAGVEIVGTSRTNIKEHQSWMRSETRTDETGRFILEHLHRDYDYDLSLGGPGHWRPFLRQNSQFPVPEEGTRMIRKPFSVFPKAKDDRVWVYTPGRSDIRSLDYGGREPLAMRVSGAPFNDISDLGTVVETYILSDEEIEAGALAVSSRDYLVCTTRSLKRIVPLTRVGSPITRGPQSVLGLTRRYTDPAVSVDVPAGWYYNLREVWASRCLVIGPHRGKEYVAVREYGECDDRWAKGGNYTYTIGSIRDCHKSRGFYKSGGDIAVQLAPGTYLLQTSSSRPEGYVLRVE